MGTKKRSDAEIMDGSPITTTFNGIDYVWRQHPRREQRKIRERLLGIAGILYGVDAKSEMDQAACSLESVNAILEFCEDYNGDMLDDIDDIENYIQTSGAHSFVELVQNVYIVLYEAWLAPWIEGDPKKKTKRANTAKAKPTK
jgi:hypothetical protein